MSQQREARKEKQKAQEFPVNFKCGRCKQVVPYSEGYKCPNCDKEEEEEVL